MLTRDGYLVRTAPDGETGPASAFLQIVEAAAILPAERENARWTS